MQYRIEPAERAAALSPVYGLVARFVGLTWGLRPRLYAFVRFADSLNLSKSAQADQLPSWNDGASKQAIVDFVNRVTKEGGPDFVPVNERIATFDNDGTLWAE